MTTREDYISKFDSLDNAISYENSALSVGDEFLPDFARAVRDGDTDFEPEPRYWDWLIGQLEEERGEAL